MNVHKHMEAIFIVALATVGLGTMVIDGMPEATASASAPVIRDVAACRRGTAIATVSPRDRGFVPEAAVQIRTPGVLPRPLVCMISSPTMIL